MMSLVVRRSAAVCALLLCPLATRVGAAQQVVVQHLTIHGYLTEGYAISRGGLVLGIDNQGTYDYRRAAILGRYQLKPSESFVIQLANRRLGDSPVMRYEQDVKLDLAFYQHNFSRSTMVRLGKMPLPFGIFNEIRYAGTLLPFYRPAFSVYWEGQHTSETVDGALLSHVLRSGEPWSLSVDAYVGSMQYLETGTEVDPATGTPAYRVAPIESRSAAGTQLWLTMPIDGLRVGASVKRHEDEGGLSALPGLLVVDMLGSIDGAFDRVQLRAEALRSKSTQYRAHAAYALVGVRPHERFAFNVQADRADMIVPGAPYMGRSIPYVRDYAASLNVFLDDATVVKLEAHATRGFNVEQVTNYLGTPLSGSYFITSFSVSF